MFVNENLSTLYLLLIQSTLELLLPVPVQNIAAQRRSASHLQRAQGRILDNVNGRPIGTLVQPGDHLPSTFYHNRHKSVNDP